MKTCTFALTCCLAALAACGSDAPDTTDAPQTVDVTGEAPAVTYKPDHDAESFIGKPQGPVRIEYRVIGEPVVGQPVTIDLRLTSNVGEMPVQLDMRLPDATAIEIPVDQVRTIALAAPLDESSFGHQLTVVPQREGRLFVNVSASVETPDGTMSTVTAIPLQVGEGGRLLQDNGTVIETEEGELLRTLPGK